jgi:hypothetical protein
VIEADNEAQALAIAQQMHSRSQLGWTYNGLPIPAFNGPVASIWSNPGLIPPPGPKKVKVVLQVSPTSVIFGNPVTATCTIAPGATGPVTFYDLSTSTDLGTVIPNGLGVAVLPDVTLPVGTQNIQADFAGDLYFAAGVSNIVPVTVAPPATATAIVASPNPQNFGGSVHIVATVTSGLGTPGGLVKFYDGGVQIGSAALSAGSCFINVTTLPVGVNMLTAVYQGSPEFSASTSPVFNETIIPVATATTVMSSLPNSDYDQLVVFTSTTTASTSVTFGTVTFTAIPTIGPPISLPSGSVNVSGQASVSSSTIPVGMYTIQATYLANSSFATSTGTTPQTVGMDPTMTSVMSSSPTSNVGQNVTFTASVTSTFGTVNAGSVDIIAIPTIGPNIDISGGPQPVNGSGQVIVNYSALPAEMYTIQATYGGTVDFGSSVGTTSQTVNAPTVVITVTNSPTSFNTLYSAGLTLQASLAGSGPIPTGTVTFYAGATSGWPGDATVVPGGSGINIIAGVAHVTIPSSGIGIGTYTISCSYSGDGNYAPVTYTIPITSTLTVVDPFNIVTSSNASTSGSTLTDSSVNFLAGGEYSVQVNDQVIMTATGNNYQILTVGTHTLTVQSVGTPVNGDGGPFDPADVGSGLSYIIQSSNISPNQFWSLASNPPGTYNVWVATVQQGVGTAPTPTGTMFFYYFQPEFSHASYWAQLGLIGNVTNNGGLIQISTAGVTMPSSDVLDLPHGFQTGQQAVIAGVVGVPANGPWTVTVIDSVTFTLNGSTFSGSYVSGGTTAHVMSGGSASFSIDEGGAEPFGEGSSQLLALSVCYNGDVNYSASPNPGNDATLPPGAPQMDSVHTRSAG